MPFKRWRFCIFCRASHFTTQDPQDWYYDDKGNILHWPVDHYFTEGIRNAKFLGEEVIKYHRALTIYLNSLIKKKDLK